MKYLCQGSFGARTLRTMACILPLVAFGFLLGTGRPFSQGAAASHSAAESPVRITLQEPDGQNPGRIFQAGQTRLVPLPAQQPGELRLAGEVDGALRHLVSLDALPGALPEAIRICDEQAVKEDWTFSEPLTRQLGDRDSDQVLRAYTRKGSIRIAAIGPVQEDDGGRRPVTIYAGLLAEHGPQPDRGSHP